MNESELIAALSETGRRRETLYLNHDRVSSLYEQMTGPITEFTKSENLAAKFSGSILGVINAEGSRVGAVSSKIPITESIKAILIERASEPIDLGLFPTRKGPFYKYSGNGYIFPTDEELSSKNPNLSHCDVSLSGHAASIILAERFHQERACGKTIVLVFSVGDQSCASIASKKWIGEGEVASYHNSPPLGILGAHEKLIEGVLFLAPIWIWHDLTENW